MRYVCSFLLLLFITGCSHSARKTVTPKGYLEEVFKIVEEHSIRRDSVDFKKIKQEAYARLKKVTTIEECYPIVKIILIDLRDRHSFFMPKEQLQKWQSTSKAVDKKGLITFTSKLINKNIGYIHMKGFSSGDSVTVQQYADSLQNTIQSLDNEKLIGWILDVRENGGGNCWPMLVGLGPLLGNGVCGYFTDYQQNKSSWFYQDGAAGINSMTITKVSKKAYQLINTGNPVAILTGPRTASSGEVVVAAFHHHPNARSFGEGTAGLSSANEKFVLSDGSAILLTTAIDADRDGNIFGKRIEPDEKISISHLSSEKPDDLVIVSAVDWINKK